MKVIKQVNCHVNQHRNAQPKK